MSREFKPRPSRHIYAEYDGKLGKVVGVSEARTKCGHVNYEVQCADCGQIHLRDAKHLKQGIKSAECVYYRPPNWSGLEKEDARLQREYGISQDDLNALIEFQNGQCGICFKTFKIDTKTMNVDHDHNTGIVRGVLCSSCNTGLGQLGDSIDGIKRALYYLKNTPFSEFTNALAR
jgi:hypothetical protein